MGKEGKEKTQVEEAKEAKNARAKKTPEPERREESPPVDMEMELEGEDWAKSATPEFSFDISEESRDYIPDYA